MFIGLNNFTQLNNFVSAKLAFGLFNRVKLKLEQHKKGLGEYVKDKGPFKLIYFEGCLNQQDATHREKYFKTYLGRMFLKNRLKSYLTR